MPGLIPREKLTRMEKDAVMAWLRKDQEALHAAVDPLFTEGTPDDALIFILDITMVTYGKPQPGSLVQPIVGRYDEATGEVATFEIDEVPLGVRTYARIATSFLSGDMATVAALYRVLLDAPEPDDLQLCMSTALAQAARAVVERGFRL